jgi:hypothetical protein
MSADIVTAKHQEITRTVHTDNDTFMSVIAQAVSSPDASIDNIRQLLELKERFDMKEAEKAFNSSFSQLTAEIEPIVKRGSYDLKDNKGTIKFGKFSDIDAAIRPALAKHGFSIMFDAEPREGGGAIVIGTLCHQAGHSKSSKVSLALDSMTNNAQAMASTISKGRRYVTSMLLNLAFIDDDAATGTHLIDAETAAEIEKRIEATGSDRAAFLGIFGVESVSALPENTARAAFALLAKKQKAAS